MKKPFFSVNRGLITLAILVALSLLVGGCSSGAKETHISGGQWTKISPGIWKTQRGTEHSPSLLTESGAVPRMQSLALLPDTSFPVEDSEISVRIEKGRTYIRFPLVDGEQLFGLGLNFKNVNQRGRIFRLHVDHYEGRYSVRNLITKLDRNGALSGHSEEKVSSGPWPYTEINWKYMTEKTPARK